MDKGLSKISKGRLTVAMMALVCLVAIVAAPTLAFAHTPAAAGTITTSYSPIVWNSGISNMKIHTGYIKVGAGPWLHAAAYNVDNTAMTVKVFAAGLQDGANVVQAKVRDTTGAWNTGTWTFTVACAPKFGAKTPGNQQHFTSARTVASIKISDNTAVTTWTATVNGTAATAAYAAGTLNISGFSAGLPYNTIAVTAGDAAGNSSTKTWGFFVNGSVTASAACMNCHRGAQVGLSSQMIAGGHNTTENGTTGARTKFDGSQGVTLRWIALQSFTVTSILTQSSTNGTAAVDTQNGTTFTAGQTGIVKSNWALPTKSVFWPAVNDGVQDAPSTAIKGLTWNSVITCEDCHTGFTATGPHGATVNGGLDPAYPADYGFALLTKKVTGGTTTTSLGSVAGRFAASGIAVGTSGTTPATKMSTAAGWMDGTSGANAVICAKCHRLESVVPSGTAAGQSGTAWPQVIGANTAHNSHHQDSNTGQCVSCHVAIPHGWVAPRLLVDIPEWEGTPFVSEDIVEDMGSIAALNNHPLIGADGYLPYTNNGGAQPANNIALAGTVLWDEGQCDACGDHYGQQLSWVVSGSGVTTTTAQGNGLYNYSVPVRIDF